MTRPATSAALAPSHIHNIQSVYTSVFSGLEHTRPPSHRSFEKSADALVEAFLSWSPKLSSYPMSFIRSLQEARGTAQVTFRGLNLASLRCVRNKFLSVLFDPACEQGKSFRLNGVLKGFARMAPAVRSLIQLPQSEVFERVLRLLEQVIKGRQIHDGPRLLGT
jgi:hypothetical protein